jgi:protein-L-isoaspartate(D-aspartate) O-methyltransferase
MDAVTLQRRLLREISTYHPHDGDPRRLQPALRKAFMACPRHCFVKRFKIDRSGPTYSLTKRTSDRLLPLIYRDETLQFYVGKSGKLLPASNSEPGFAMYLLEMLDLRRGQKVLEIGSGGGWLSAIMAQVVGPKGRGVGIEVIPELADHSKHCIKALGPEIDLDNLTIMTGDGGKGMAPSSRYDRVLVTAGSQSFPVALFDQVADRGKVVIPLSYRGGGEEVRLLSKEAHHFRSTAAIPGFFVPLVGASQLTNFNGIVLDDLPVWQSVRDQPCLRQPFWLGGRGKRSVMMRSFWFRSYLSKTESGYRIFLRKKKDQRSWPESTYGIVDEQAGSVATVDGHHLVGYGSPKAANAMIRGYRNWTKAFMPAGVCFDLSIYRLNDTPEPTDRQWRERRGSCDFLWSLSDGVC